MIIVYIYVLKNVSNVTTTSLGPGGNPKKKTILVLKKV